MKKLLVGISLFISVYVWGSGNLVFNPGFDETPWDTGWTFESRDSGNASQSYRRVSTRYYRSSPQSCRLHAAGSGYRDEVWAWIYMYQEIVPVVDCTCRAYFKTSRWLKTLNKWRYQIFIKINGQWIEEWMDSADNSWTKWEKTYTSSDTISGIKFRVYIFAHQGNQVMGNFWIDDVYIRGTRVGVEETGYRSQVTGYRLKAYPNPFVQVTSLKSQVSNKNEVSLKIYDMGGRLVEETNGSIISRSVWLGKGLRAGVYWVKVVNPGGSRAKGYKPVKIVKLR